MGINPWDTHRYTDTLCVRVCVCERGRIDIKSIWMGINPWDTHRYTDTFACVRACVCVSVGALIYRVSGRE